MNRFKVPTLAVLAAALAAGCSAMPDRNAELEQARALYGAAAADPHVTTQAPVELNSANQTLQQAESLWRSGAERPTVDHYAYLAAQRTRIAQEAAQLKVAEQLIANAGQARDQVLLQSRTAEAERATRDAQAAQQQARAAQETAALQSQQTEAVKRAAEARASQLEAQLAELQAKKTDRGYVLTLGSDVLFDVGQANLKPGADRSLTQLSQFLTGNPTRKVGIEGFTDSTGSDDYNLSLSRRRAEAVKDALVTRGIDPARVDVRGFGKSYPIATNGTAAGRQLNRRVEVVIPNEGSSNLSERR